MNNKIKNLVAGVVLLAFIGVMVMALKPVPIYAQDYYYTPSTVVKSTGAPAAVTLGSSAWTNTIAGSTCFTNFTVIDKRAGKSLSLELTQRSDGANTANLIVFLGRNLSGTGLNNTNVETWKQWPVAAAGNATTVAVTNIAETELGAVPFVYIVCITNAAASASVTNYQIRAFVK